MRILDLKNILKTFKLNESTVSMVLGAVVILIVGILVVNYFKKSDEGDTFIAETTQETSESPQEGKKYVVKEGDTLWSIAEEAYGDGFSWTKIAEANDLSLQSSIEEGQELDIPDLGMTSEESQMADEEEEMEEPVAMEEETQKETLMKSEEETEAEAMSQVEITGDTYTVVHGDNLWKISERAYGTGFKWVEIARENNLANPNLIHAGNVLKLPR